MKDKKNYDHILKLKIAEEEKPPKKTVKKLLETEQNV